MDKRINLQCNIDAREFGSYGSLDQKFDIRINLQGNIDTSGIAEVMEFGSEIG